MAIKICSYLEVHVLVDQSGIGRATRNFVMALARQGIDVTSDPNEDYDLLHLQWVGPRSLYHARQAHKKGRPVVLSVHTLPELIKGAFTCSRLISPPYGRYLRGFIRHVDLLVAPSPLAASHLRPVADGQPIRVVSSGVDLDQFRYDQEKRDVFRREYSLDSPTVLAVGQVSPLKGVRTFFEVARLLPELLFLWVGPRVNPLLFYGPRFERLLRRRPANARFTGFIEQVNAAYSGSDLFFFPSHVESLGLAILEAAAVGLPIVVRRLPVYQGWLIEEENCLMACNTEEFIVAISTLLSDHPPTLAMEDLAQEHSLTRVGMDLVAVYQEVL